LTGIIHFILGITHKTLIVKLVLKIQILNKFFIWQKAFQLLHLLIFSVIPAIFYFFVFFSVARPQINFLHYFFPPIFYVNMITHIPEM